MFEFRECQKSVFVELCSRSCNVIMSVILNGNKGRNEIRDGTLFINLFNQISDSVTINQSEVSLKQSTRLLKNKPPIITLYINL